MPGGFFFAIASEPGNEIFFAWWCFYWTFKVLSYSQTKGLNEKVNVSSKHIFH